MAQESILVLDADWNAGLAIVQSLGAAGYRCIAAAKDNRASAFCSRYASDTAIYPDPMTDALAFGRWISAWLHNNDVALVIPVTECTLIPLHRLRDDTDFARRIAMPSKECIDVAIDKERLRALAVKLGVPVPPSVYVTRADDLTDARIDDWLHEGGAIVKTTMSKVWKEDTAVAFPTIIAGDHDELERAVLERLPHVPVHVQQWVPGRGLGVDILAREGEIVMSIAHERLHEVPLTGGGSSYRRTVPMPPELYADAQLLMRALRYDGVAMVEFRGDPVTGTHWLMEINTRFWGSLPLAIYAGADFPRALAAMLLHNETPHAPTPRNNVYARQIEYDVNWIKLMLKRRGRVSPHELAPPLGKALLEWARVFTGNETWDGANLKDPKPLLREIQHVVGQVLGAAYRRGRSGTIQKVARRSSVLRARGSPGARILFLCYGNVCRSPYAAQRFRVRGGASCEIRSAGFHPTSGRMTPEDFQRAARRHGIDLAGHRSRCVTLDDLRWAHIIVLMDQRNYDLVREMNPKSLRKVVWLGALDGNGIEIDDPHGETEQRVDELLGRMDACLDRLCVDYAPSKR